MKKRLSQVLVPVLGAVLWLSTGGTAQAGRLGAELRNAPNGGGAQIVSVQANSIANDLGLQAGYVIIALDGRPVTSAAQVQEYIANPNLKTVQLTYTDPAQPAGANTYLVTADVEVLAAYEGRGGGAQVKKNSVKRKKVPTPRKR